MAGTDYGSYLSNSANFYGQPGQFQGQQLQAFQGALQCAQFQENQQMVFSGDKPVVICGGVAKEAKGLVEAQAFAESMAHAQNADAYILKPVKKVSPKRDVVTTDLP